jgi:hypothetical protein
MEGLKCPLKIGWSKGFLEEPGVNFLFPSNGFLPSGLGRLRKGDAGQVRPTPQCQPAHNAQTQGAQKNEAGVVSQEASNPETNLPFSS